MSESIGITQENISNTAVSPEATATSQEFEQVFKERRVGIDNAWDRALNIGDANGYVWEPETEAVLRQSHGPILDQLVEIAGARENNKFNEDETYTVTDADGNEVTKNARDVLPGVISALDAIEDKNPHAKEDAAVLRDAFRAVVVTEDGKKQVLTYDEWKAKGEPKGDYQSIVPMDKEVADPASEEESDSAAEGEPQGKKEKIIAEVKRTLDYYRELRAAHKKGETKLHSDPKQAEVIMQNIERMYPEMNREDLTDDDYLQIQFRDNQRLALILSQNQQHVTPAELTSETQRIVEEQKLFDQSGIDITFADQLQKEFSEGGILDTKEKQLKFYQSYALFRDKKDAMIADLARLKDKDVLFKFTFMGKERTINKKTAGALLKGTAVTGGVLMFIILSQVMGEPQQQGGH